MTVAVAAGAVLIAAAVAIARIPNLVAAPRAFLLLLALAFVAYAAGAWALRPLAGRAPLILTLVVAAAARLVLVGTMPTLSTDAYRYVWDARITSAGISPYSYGPSAPELQAFRDNVIYPSLNHPGWPTIYPPGAQAFFRAVYTIAPESVLAMKLAIAAAEAAALGLLVFLLGGGEAQPWRLAVYAWNPLVIVEIWASAHLEGLVVLIVVAAVAAALSGRRGVAAALIAVGTLVKFYPAILLPLVLVNRRGPRWVVPAGAPRTQGPAGRPDARRLPGAARRERLLSFGIFAAIVAAGYAPARYLGAAMIGSLPLYVVYDHFNPGIIRTLINRPEPTLVATGLWVAWCALRRPAAPLPERAVPLIGGFLLLAPNLFPWYAVLLVPFLALAPSLPWIAFTGTVALAYTFFLQHPWSIPTWARAVEVLPLVAGASYAVARRAMGRRPQPSVAVPPSAARP
jgi:hypothetical protein